MSRDFTRCGRTAEDLLDSPQSQPLSWRDVPAAFHTGLSSMKLEKQLEKLADFGLTLNSKF